MSLATEGFSAMISFFPMAVTGWIYQPTEIAQDFFSSAGNVAEKIVQVKGGKFQVLFRPESRSLQIRSSPRLFAKARSGWWSQQVQYSIRLYEKAHRSNRPRRCRVAHHSRWGEHLFPWLHC
jgi:hypothetical protein